MSEELMANKLELLRFVNDLEIRLHLFRGEYTDSAYALGQLNLAIDVAIRMVMNMGVYLEQPDESNQYVSIRQLVDDHGGLMDQRFSSVCRSSSEHKVSPLAFNTLNRTIMELQYNTPELEEQFWFLRRAIQQEFGIS